MDSKCSSSIDLSKVSDSIEPFFTKEELDKMSAYEKKHLQNLRSNYEALQIIGLYPDKPDFMKSTQEKKKIEKMLEEEVEIEEDEEWLPGSKRKRPPPPQHKKKIPADKVERKVPRFPRRKQVEQSSCEIISRVLRHQPAKCMALEIPSDDAFIYCEECNEEYLNDCPIHGPLIIIKDSEVKVRTSNYAEKTAPVCVIVKESNIPNAGLGVFAKEPIPNRTRFGPYKGEITKNEDKAQLSGYSWQIYSDGKASHFMDAHNPMTSNWMRFVNCARSEDEQNLTAFQFMGEIYYKTLRLVSRGEELLVWYGEEYAKDLGICSSESKKKQNLSKNDVTVSQSEVSSLKDLGVCQNNESNWKDAEKQSLSFENKKGEAQKMKEEKCQKVSKAEKDMKRINVNISNKGKRPFQCEICLKTFTLKSNLNQHLMIHKGERPFQCEICLKTFTHKVSLNRHLMMHKGERPFQCEICLKTFTQTGHLNQHLMMHKGERPFQCEICLKTFTRTSCLNQHLMIHKGERPFQCEICLKTFTQTSSLNRHLMMHKGERPFQCEICLKTFTLKSNLNQHLMMHKGERPFQCEICLKTFTQTSSLNRHLMMHKGERPFQCEICLKTFTLKSNLNQHLMMHKGERPFQCEICLKTFTRTSCLNQHLMIHKGERPFQCEICLKTFTHKVSLNQHLMMHKGERPFQCEICLKTFTLKSNLNQHKKIHS